MHQVLYKTSNPILTMIRALCLLAVMLGAGCTSAHSDWRTQNELNMQQTKSISDEQNQAIASDALPVLATSKNLPDEPAPKAAIYRGQTISHRSSASQQPKARHSSQSNAGDIVLRFSNTPVRDVAQIILGDHLGKTFSVAPQVQGSINLDNQAGLTKQDLIPVLETLLGTVDAHLSSNEQGYQILPGALTSLPDNLANLQLLPLRYLDADEFIKILDSLPVTATAVPSGNLVAVSANSRQMEQVLSLAKSFDINWFSGVSVGLFPVKHASAETLRTEVLALLGKELEQAQAGAVRLVTIQRSNTLMVIARQATLIEQVGEWVERLDQISASSSDQFFIYRVQNGRATDLALLLGQMFGNTPVDTQTDIFDNNQADAVEQPQSAASNFRAIADESTNSVIVSGGPQYYQAIRQAMKQLDSTPLQVLVEARIMELTLNDDLKFGLEWFLNGSRASSNTSATLDLGRAGLNAIQPGFSYIIERAGEVRAALNGLADDSRLKVLSSPSLMVLNNRTASILVGDEIPVPTRQVVSNISPEAPTVNEIEYRNTGILLTVTPRVNSGGMVTMDISQEVSSVVNNTVSQIDAPTIQQRRVNSTVSIRSGQTVVLGGLIREQSSVREAGVPVLKEIPGLGKLFSTTSNTSQRTELVVLITPRVISSGHDASAITEEYRQKLLGLKPIPLQRM